MSAAARRMSSGSGCALFKELIFAVAHSLPGLAEYQVRVDERVEIAAEHAIHVSDGELSAVVLDHPVGSQHITANLAAEVDVELGSFGLARLFPLFLELEFVHSGAELLHGAIAVLVLRPL